MALHKNLIDGEWTGGEPVPNINPSNVKEVVGEYARATAEDAARAIAAAKAAFPAWSRSGPLERHGVLRKAADEILARKEELGRLLAREEGKSLPESIGETVRAAQIFDFFAGECLRLTGETVPSVRPGRRRRDDPRGGGGGRAHHALELPDRHPGLEGRAGARLRQHGGPEAGRPGAGLRLGDRRHPAPGGAAEGGAEPRHGQGLGRRPGDPRQPGRERDQLHRQPGDRRRGWPRRASR